jgi:hypothetical protein
MTKAGIFPSAFNYLPKELTALYPEDNKKPINTLRRGKKTAPLKVEADGIYNNHCPLHGTHLKQQKIRFEECIGIYCS